MKLTIDKIKVSEGRRELSPAGIDKLVESMAVVGLLNPITADENYTLIAGNHRLEAAKRLGWTEIECSVTDLEGLEAELAEIDENVTRTNLSGVALGEVLRRRKEIYEQLHPEAKARNRPGHVSNFQSSSDNLTFEVKPFAEDTAEKLGVGKRTVERLVQMASDLTPEAREIIKNAGKRITKDAAIKISRLEPDKQKDAALCLASGSQPPSCELREQEDEADSETILDAATLADAFQVFVSDVLYNTDGYRGYADILADLPRERIVEISDSIEEINERMRTMLYEVMSIQYERKKS